MRVKYEVDTDRTTGMIESLGGIDIIFESEFEIVWLGYIIDYNLIDYLLKSDVTCYEDEYEHDTNYLKVFNKLYGRVPPRKSLTKKAMRWLQIGTDFMLMNYREYITQMFYKKGKFMWEKENKVMKQYVIDNKEEFPEVYLEIIL